MDRGYLYSCGGGMAYLREAIESARSVRRWDPNADICLVHRYSPAQLRTCDTSVFSVITPVQLDGKLPAHIEGGMVDFLAKIQALQQSPFRRTLYLDSDTRVLAAIDDVFALAERFDIAVAAGPITQKPESSADVIRTIPKTFPEPNTGVILWNSNERVRSLFEKWLTAFRDNRNGLFRRHGKGGEQVALRYLLWMDETIRLHFFTSPEVPNLHNFRWDAEKRFEFKHRIRILHHRSSAHRVAKNPLQNPAPGKKIVTHRTGETSVAPTNYQAAAALFDRYCADKGSSFFLIQIGANDGKTCDPLWHRIQKYRWKGVMVEPVKHLFDKLRDLHANTPGLVFENLAIATHDGTTPFYHFPEEFERDPNFPFWAKGMGSILGKFESPGHETLAKRGFGMMVSHVPCLSLHSLCLRHRVTAVDLLQIDAEGYDADILCNTDLGMLRPRFIQYENRHIERLFKQGRSRWKPADVAAHLTAAGYQVFPVGNGFDNFCVRSDSV